MIEENREERCRCCRLYMRPAGSSGAGPAACSIWATKKPDALRCHMAKSVICVMVLKTLKVERNVAGLHL